MTNYSFVAAEELGRWLAASDVIALPYREILNSGSLHLAGSAHCPVIIPGDRHLRDQFHRYSWVRYFDADEGAGSLASVLTAESREPARTDPVLYRDFLAESAPVRVSRAYAMLLDRLVPHGDPDDNAMAHPRM